MEKLKDKVVVITGGTKGLGKSLALSFLRAGSSVMVCSKNEEELKQILNEGILGIKADVTKEEELNNLLNIATEKFGKVDIWVNNAGIWLPHAYVEDFDMNKTRDMFDVNVFGTINGSRVALRFMKEKGSGTIVNIISDSALAERPMSSLYCASKWAVNGFTKSIRAENKNILILSVYPAGIKTSIFGENQPKEFNDFMSPEYVADIIVENLKKDKPEEELIIKRNT